MNLSLEDILPVVDYASHSFGPPSFLSLIGRVFA